MPEPLSNFLTVFLIGLSRHKYIFSTQYTAYILHKKVFNTMQHMHAIMKIKLQV